MRAAVHSDTVTVTERSGQKIRTRAGETMRTDGQGGSLSSWGGDAYPQRAQPERIAARRSRTHGKNRNTGDLERARSQGLKKGKGTKFGP